MLKSYTTHRAWTCCEQVHDIGKVLSLFGEEDANVDGLNTRLLRPASFAQLEKGKGMDQVRGRHK